jgi:hypothetical protein
MKRTGIIFIAILISFTTESFAQKETGSNQVMSLKQFYELVYLNHPLEAPLLSTITNGVFQLVFHCF